MTETDRQFMLRDAKRAEIETEQEQLHTQIAKLQEQMRQRAEEAERAYDGLVRTTAEETPYWQAIARAAEILIKLPGVLTWAQQTALHDAKIALDVARSRGLTWEEERREPPPPTIPGVRAR